ncbi:HD domain-containing protein [Staphylococcus pettenkoferi]|uniref:HD domain-containing protein n=1 Tax=Staphylococcus pettenkoferi TaxID=170573 RepID=A0ABT4BI50_9STAP|nr:HD domain-containing protein [Staphylococcus pettenkoferi]MCY1565415.1 HD domain-containing protein [Staphylococcus pettenkoferi]MCY1570895.1 HD domain-containing protein [Staphylococcus pettenkoferi]MCY1582299.1 HD domain-containing protein [Staphylococcus pettenkoferi]MCY1590564.1 HD domain-containing protein [Staphylococcus pettenkoferi]MCY1599920.1 HD domain-containing protein [Staphylococcus pettenkoferi]
MEKTEQIWRAEQYMKEVHQYDASGHDVAHVYRVVSLALYLADQEDASVDAHVIHLAALLHDTVDEKLFIKQDAPEQLQRFLTEIELTHAEIENIRHIIQYMSYRGGRNNHITLSLEGQIVRDADRLDALGAIGIARTFQFAGHSGEAMWTSNATFDQLEQASEDEIQSLTPSAIQHFYEKLFKLRDLMHTKSGRALAEQRHQFMKQFVETFLTEWNFDKSQQDKK